MSSFFTLDNISPVFSSQANSRQTLYTSIMNQGARFVQSQNYEQAIVAFRRASAYSSGSVDPYILMGRTYQAMGQAENAIASFRKALKVDPTSTDARTYLAYAYLTSNRNAEAELEFKRLLAVDATDARSTASLGHIYLATGRASEAEAQFRKAIHLAPLDAAGYDSLGLALNAQKRYSEALDQFERAIAIKPGYAPAYGDMASAYIGLGDPTSAGAQATVLDDLNTDESKQLAEQIRAELFTPKIAYADISQSDFNPLFGPDTPLLWLDSSLSTPGASKAFKMVFKFNQPMDQASVENTLNWDIRQATGGPGGVYANGVVLNYGRQVQILPIPTSITYNPVTHEATVSFRITQNAAGDGLIDPSHWIFRFTGTDASGHPMDPNGDEWDGKALGSF